MTSLEADPGSPADAGAGRAADAIAFVGGALVLVAVLVLGFGLYSDRAERLALLSSAGCVALAAAWATRRLLPAAVSDVLAGIAAVIAGPLLGCRVARDWLGDQSPRMRWILICGALMSLGGALCWWLRSRVAGALAVAAWVALPAALATSRPEDVDLAIPFLRAGVPEISVWASLALMVLAATVVEQATQFAARRGWVDPSTAVWTAFVATTVLGTALVLAATLAGSVLVLFHPCRRCSHRDRGLGMAAGVGLAADGGEAVLDGCRDRAGRSRRRPRPGHGAASCCRSASSPSHPSRGVCRAISPCESGRGRSGSWDSGCPARLRLRRAVGRPRAGCGRLP